MRPVPRPTPTTRPFWDACRAGRLTVQRCRACAAFVFVPQAFCSSCQSVDLEWVDSEGLATVITYTVVWRPQTTAFEAPYTVAVVRLDEGYEMLTNVVGSDPEDITIGARARVRFVDIGDDVTLPCFERVAS